MPEDKPTVKFGINQINNPTPSKLNLWVKVITIVIGVFMGFMAVTDLIGPHSKDALNQILGLLVIPLINGLAPLFGMTGVGSYVKTSDVSSMDEPKK